MFNGFQSIKYVYNAKNRTAFLLDYFARKYDQSNELVICRCIVHLKMLNTQTTPLKAELRLWPDEALSEKPSSDVISP